MNLLLFYPDEIQSEGVAAVTGPRAVNIIKQHEITKTGISLKAGVRGGKIGKALVTTFDINVVGHEKIDFQTSFTEEPPQRNDIEVIIGLPRPQTVKKIIQVATSFGIAAIHFVPFEKTIKSYQSSKIWTSENIENEIMESLQQVCDTCAPNLFRYPTLKEFYSNFVDRLPEFWQQTVVFDSRGAINMNQHSTFKYLIFGPESGFSDSELELFSNRAVTLVSLGQRMLRLEHAVCASLQTYSNTNHSKQLNF
jgi:16S rRNA (uracil1498-N3)-methyltransferase